MLGTFNCFKSISKVNILYYFYIIRSILNVKKISFLNFFKKIFKIIIYLNYYIILIINNLRTAKEWINIFKRYNSGTYNNQWTVVDYKLFQPGKELPTNGLIWILEQLP